MRRLTIVLAAVAAAVTLAGCGGMTPEEQRWAQEMCLRFSTDSVPLNAAYTEMTSAWLAGATSGRIDRPRLHALIAQARGRIRSLRGAIGDVPAPTDRSRHASNGLLVALRHYDRGLALFRRTVDAPPGSNAQLEAASQGDKELGKAQTRGMAAVAELLEIWGIDLPDEVDAALTFVRAFRAVDPAYVRLDAADQRFLDALADADVPPAAVLRVASEARAAARRYAAALDRVEAPTDAGLSRVLFGARYGARSVAKTYALAAAAMKTDKGLDRLNEARQRAFTVLAQAEVDLQASWSRVLGTALGS